MSDKRQPWRNVRPKKSTNKRTEDFERTTPENDPAIERGERIATGKMIARSGKSSGSVPGATRNDLT